MERMKLPANEWRFLAPAFLVLFLGLAVLAVFLLVGESGRARILTEYEADRTAYALADEYRTAGSLDPASLDPRIRGFGLYRPSGEAVARVGSAPTDFSSDEARPGFTYDSGKRLLTLVRVAGMDPSAMHGMMGGTGMRGMMGDGPGYGPGPGFTPGREPGRGPFHGPAGTLYLSMDIGSYYRMRALYRTAAAVAPLAVAGIAALFLSLLASNARHRKRAEERETLARLGESARTLTHEIRNPLGAIRIHTGLLRKKLPPGDAAHLDAIDEEIERLSTLTRRVTDFTKNPKGTPERIVVEAWLRDLAGKLPGDVSFNAAGDQSKTAVRFDAELLRSVVENLARNAFESYGDDGSQGLVEIELSGDKGRVVIAVRDRGKGIPPQLSERVFDPFFTDKVHGSGVGLALSRRFVQAAGGTLSLSPRRGGGTEARVTLPAEASA